jgi:hypothetical protein
MLFNTEKFNSEIKKLKTLSKEPVLHGLKKARLKQSILANLSSPEIFSSNPVKVTFFKRAWVLHYALPSFAIFILLTGTTFASNASVPGDALYPIKQAKENIQLTLSPSAEAKATLKARFAEERIKEIKKIRASLSKPQTMPSANTSTPINETSTLPKAESESEHRAKDNLNEAEKDLNETKKELDKKGKTKAAQKIRSALLKIKQEKEEEKNETLSKDLLQKYDIINFQTDISHQTSSTPIRLQKNKTQATTSFSTISPRIQRPREHQDNFEFEED